MKSFSPLLAIPALVVFAATNPAAEEDDPDLSPEQRKNLIQLRVILEKIPTNAAASETEQRLVEANLKKTLEGNYEPSKQTSSALNGLAGHLTSAVSTGQMTIQDSLRFSKELTKVLNVQDGRARDIRSLVKTIETGVEGTNLGRTERMRLYADMLTLVAALQKNAREQR